MYDAPALDQGHQFDPHVSGEYSTIDMVNRLDPVGFHWIESSPAEQIFLGWTISELRTKSFLDIVLADDRRRAAETLGQALVRGEALGLVVRVQTALGKTRAIEGAMSGPATAATRGSRTHALPSERRYR